MMMLQMNLEGPCSDSCRKPIRFQCSHINQAVSMFLGSAEEAKTEGGSVVYGGKAMSHLGDYVELTSIRSLAHDVSFVHTETLSQLKDKEEVFA